jgi:uncharacterized membrane protein
MEKFINLFRNKEVSFTAIFLIFGLIFIFITPPIYTVDESTHLYRAYQISQLNLVPDNISKTESGGTVPNGLAKFVAVSLMGPVQKYAFLKSTSRDLKINLSSSGQKDIVNFTNESIYPFVDYIPQALGLKFGNLITQRVLIQFYIARIFNLLFLATCLFFAIRLIPRGKTALIAVGLLPMTIYAAASLSPDVFVIGSVALFMAYLFKLYCHQTSIATRQWLIMACLALGVVLSKQTYFILTISVLSLGFKHGKVNKKELIRSFAVLFLCLAILVSYLFVTRGLNTQPIALQHAVGVFANPHKQENIIIRHPITFIKASIKALESRSLLPDFFGNFGISNIPLPTFAFLLSFLLLFLSFGFEKHKTSPDNKFVTLTFVLAASLNILLILGGLYVYWSDPGQTTVGFLNPRYFIPVLILLIPVLIGRYRHPIRWATVFTGLVIVLIASVATIAAHFYVL